MFNEQKFREILPTQDDVWFWGMAVLNKTKTTLVEGYSIQLITDKASQQYGLSKINAKNNTGISACDGIKLITEHYPQILEIIKEEN